MRRGPKNKVSKLVEELELKILLNKDRDPIRTHRKCTLQTKRSNIVIVKEPLENYQKVEKVQGRRSKINNQIDIKNAEDYLISELKRQINLDLDVFSHVRPDGLNHFQRACKNLHYNLVEYIIANENIPNRIKKFFPDKNLDRDPILLLLSNWSKSELEEDKKKNLLELVFEYSNCAVNFEACLYAIVFSVDYYFTILAKKKKTINIYFQKCDGFEIMTRALFIGGNYRLLNTLLNHFESDSGKFELNFSPEKALQLYFDSLNRYCYRLSLFILERYEIGIEANYLFYSIAKKGDVELAERMISNPKFKDAAHYMLLNSDTLFLALDHRNFFRLISNSFAQNLNLYLVKDKVGEFFIVALCKIYFSLQTIEKFFLFDLIKHFFDQFPFEKCIYPNRTIEVDRELLINCYYNILDFIRNYKTVKLLTLMNLQSISKNDVIEGNIDMQLLNVFVNSISATLERSDPRSSSAYISHVIDYINLTQQRIDVPVLGSEKNSSLLHLFTICSPNLIYSLLKQEKYKDTNFLVINDDKETILHLLAKDINNIQIVSDLLTNLNFNSIDDQEYFLNSYDKMGNTFLHYFISQNNKKTYSKLCDLLKMAISKKFNRDTLSLQSQRSVIDLLKDGDLYQMTELLSRNLVTIEEIFIKYSRCLITEAITENRIEFLRHLFVTCNIDLKTFKFYKKHPVYYAISSHNVDIVNLLLKFGYQVDLKEIKVPKIRSAIRFAIFHQNEQILGILLQNINKVECDVDKEELKNCLELYLHDKVNNFTDETVKNLTLFVNLGAEVKQELLKIPQSPNNEEQKNVSGSKEKDLIIQNLRTTPEEGKSPVPKYSWQSFTNDLLNFFSFNQ